LKRLCLLQHGSGRRMEINNCITAFSASQVQEQFEVLSFPGCNRYVTFAAHILS
jgi:hypothetical protein